MKSKKTQEEMVGFGLVIIVVAVIILVFLWFLLSSNGGQELESFEAESFTKSVLQFTTECGQFRESHVEIKELVFDCYQQTECLSGENACDVLEKNLEGMMDESWEVGVRGIEGVYLNISVNGEEIYYYEEGNGTINSRGYSKKVSKPRQDAEVVFKIYF